MKRTPGLKPHAAVSRCCVPFSAAPCNGIFSLAGFRSNNNPEFTLIANVQLPGGKKSHVLTGR